MKRSASILTSLLLAACAGHSEASKPTHEYTKDVAVGTCQITNPGGLLPDGSGGVIGYLDDSYLGRAIETIYKQGSFPNPVTVHSQYSSPTRAELLSQATVWEWEVGPAQDASGQWTQLDLYKEVLNGANGESYEMDHHIVGFGEHVVIDDLEGQVHIDCNLPKKN